MTGAMKELSLHVVKHGFLDRNGNSLLVMKKTVLVVTSKLKLLESTTKTDIVVTESRASELLEVLA